MRVILFYIGDFPIRSYNVIVILAILLAIGIAHYTAKGTKYHKHVLNLSVYAILAGIVGARIWHVFFFQWGYYSQHLDQILTVWNGGLSILGGLVGGLVASIVYTRYHKLNFWELADIMAPALIFGQGVGRIACLLNGDAFGSPTGSNFGLVYPEGTVAYEKYGSQPLYPAEVWEGQWDFIVFGLLLILKNRKWFNGFVFLAYSTLYSLGRFLLEYLRGDSPRYLIDWTAGQWTSITIIVISLVLLGILYIKANRRKTVVTEGDV